MVVDRWETNRGMKRHRINTIKTIAMIDPIILVYLCVFLGEAESVYIIFIIFDWSDISMQQRIHNKLMYL